MLENFTYPYQPKEEEENALDGDSQVEVRAINPHNMTMIDITAIPSSANLIQCEASGFDEARAFRAKLM